MHGRQNVLYLSINKFQVKIFTFLLLVLLVPTDFSIFNKFSSLLNFLQVKWIAFVLGLFQAHICKRADWEITQRIHPKLNWDKIGEEMLHLM